jgi:hypothetical protein
MSAFYCIIFCGIGFVLSAVIPALLNFRTGGAK